MSAHESVVVRLNETGEYTAFLASAAAADIEMARLSGSALDYAVVCAGLTNEQAWDISVLLNSKGQYVLVTKDALSADGVDRERAWWTLNACIAIAMQAGMVELSECFEQMRGLL